MSRGPNPLVPGFNPDPSIVLADDAYYLVTSTFEYLPGIPVYRSTDLAEWTQIGNVATRPEQLLIGDVPTGLGVWAPTIRYREGTFYVIVTVPMSPKGCVVYTATDPAGPWDDGTTIEGVSGIDPDLTWDDEGAAYVTFSGINFDGGGHLGVQQVRADLTAGKALEEPRSLWSGTGLKFPEAPHLYHRGDWWYLLIAEGGTERGHSVSVARGRSPEGPFEGHPANPVLSARSTPRPIQNTGHADLVDTPDGGSALVLLGMRPLGATVAFSPLGRETFVTDVAWVDDWPQPEPVELAPRAGTSTEEFDFAAGDLSDPGWLAVRTLPTEVATTDGGRLVLTGDGRTMADRHPRFVGRRQRHHISTVAVRLDVTAGTGGLASRYDEHSWYGLEAHTDGGSTTVTARARVSGLAQDWTATLPAGEVELRIETRLPAGGFSPEAMGGDRIRLVAAAGGEDVEVTELDGRFWSAEVCASFTGRVVGPYAVDGTVAVAGYRYTGSESSEQHRPGEVTPH
ncbi:Xylosidase/arabinosidase [Modestobacter italicus]|uniref:Xylosidase/arabinosidase n=1 Tax=Modestobacter italicus (strain DSM 44449 / CECT 9708 / BC 501) TaxID=2732864 RepID=I4EYD6_MODI5|nr:glycoside hydrolase family 43 protein [Modestobacter marinus]CCH88399.1 Xylosidase/arabinosidase [Modestobacter marinus]